MGQQKLATLHCHLLVLIVGSAVCFPRLAAPGALIVIPRHVVFWCSECEISAPGLTPETFTDELIDKMTGQRPLQQHLRTIFL